MAKDFVVYRVHIHKTKQEQLYQLLESMPKSTRGLYIREALEYFRQTRGATGETSRAQDISFEGSFGQDFGGKV